MKIGLILTGHHRRYDLCYPALKHFILDKHDVDIYLSTWDHNYIKRELPFVPTDAGKLIDLYQPVKSHVENHVEYFKNKIFEPFINGPVSFELNGEIKTMQACQCSPGRNCDKTGCDALEVISDQLYMIQKGFDLIDNPEQYDYIMKLRLDVLLNNFNFEENLPKGTIVVPLYDVAAYPSYASNDWVAYGDPEAMKKYCYFNQFYKKSCISKSIGPVSVEFMLGYYLKFNCNITLKRDTLTQYSLCKE